MYEKLNDSVKHFIKLVIDMDINLLNAISLVYVISAVLTFGILVLGITAPYGRYARSGWGINFNANFAWLVQELPALVIPVCFLFKTLHALPGPNMMFMGLMIVHYIHRAVIFPLLITGGKPTPLAIFCMTTTFCIVNGYLQSVYLIYHAQYGPNWTSKPHIWAGVVLFLVGMITNIHSDSVLRNLRKPGETGYKIPRGGMFEYVSGANFFGEMLEWAGFAVATWSIPALAFSIFTCSNLGPRAYQHHKFYLQKFEDYPKSRKAVIPFML